MIVVAYKQGREVARWSGPIDWYWSVPMRFSAQRAGRAWQWSDAQAATMTIKSKDRRSGGIRVGKWAARAGADSVSITLIEHPGMPDANAGDRGMGTHGDGGGADASELKPGQPGVSTDLSPTSTSLSQTSATPAIGHGDGTGAMSEDAAWAAALLGQGDGGTLLGQGGNNTEGAESGRGDHRGKRGGVADGARRASWYQPPSAETDTTGARTPDLHGKRGGSAAGQRGADGNIAGPGFVSVIDAPVAVAAIVNVALIVSEADFTGFTQRFLRKAASMPIKALRKELAQETAKIVDRGLARAVKHEDYHALVQARGAEARDLVADEIERRAYQRAREYFAREAEEMEDLAAAFARQSSEADEHLARGSANHAAAYRKMERAAIEEGHLDTATHGAPTRGTAIGPDEAQSRSARTARSAGIGRPHRHHLLPQEHKKWFQQRGFPGNDIDNYCIELPEALHQAEHGGGNWLKARRLWADGEWNTVLMESLNKGELVLGRKLTKHDILAIMNELRGERELGHLPIVPYRERQ
jgi:hypothetical protein